MDDDHLHGGFLDGDLMDRPLRQKYVVVLRMGAYLFLVASLQFDDTIRHHDNFIISVPFFRGLVAFPGKDNLHLELVLRSFEHARDIRRLHG